ncbi:MAG TPA: dihydrofolate reductase family protein [Mycobacteriales bacterium]|nr:dihydrofolate reductase family protein [Mycobacteriales bacterium]
MSRIVLDVSVSLDGFTSGPNVRAEEPMGDGGEKLHEWMAAAETDPAVAGELATNVGAALVGRHTFELGLRPWGGTPWPGVPSFVVTHRSRPDLRAGNGGTFAFDGLEAAATRARQAAGDRDVFVLGAEVGRHLLRTGLLDEIRLHVVPILLGGGTPLFTGEQAELVPVSQVITGSVTHLHLRVRP